MPMPKQKPGKSKQDYETPENLLNAIKYRLGIKAFLFDFACSRRNMKGSRGWTKADDSLSKRAVEWAMAVEGGWGWLNPPFSKIGPWAKKCRQAMHKGANIAFLVPAAVGSNWFHHFIWEEKGVRVIYLNGRPCFDPKRPKWGFPKDCMLVLFRGGREDGELLPFSSDVWRWKESE